METYTGIGADFKPVRTINYYVAAAQIRDTVTVPELLTIYVAPTASGKGRMPCPIHHGQDYNFSYDDKHFKCFVCGASGDVITLVKCLFSLDFKGAADKINADLHLRLPLSENVSRRELAKVNYEYEKRRAEQQAEQEEYERLKNNYEAAWAIWELYDGWKREFAPGTPDHIDQRYVIAVSEIDKAADRLNDAEIKLFLYKQRKRSVKNGKEKEVKSLPETDKAVIRSGR